MANCVTHRAMSTVIHTSVEMMGIVYTAVTLAGTETYATMHAMLHVLMADATD